MKVGHLYLLLCIISTASVNTLEPVSASVGVGVGVALGVGLGVVKRAWTSWDDSRESCDPRGISLNSIGLELDLESKLFGQHIASRIIFKAVSGFMANNNPKKPLVLSLHGLTGTGKNFVSRLIAENIYKKGLDSSFVHVFSAGLHFPHSSLLNTYKSQLQEWIKGSVTNCEHSMFIFDEMDKMDPGLIDSIKPFLDYNKNVDKVSYRKAIFIFLSNGGGESIIETALDFHRAGRDREEIQLQDLETDLSTSVFNNKKSGLWHTSLIDKNLVDFFIPFLPLEYEHVIQCVLAEMKAKGLKTDKNVADRMAKELVYSPKSEELFASSGCKTLSSKLYYYI